MTVAHDTVTDVADRLFAAIESGDRDAISRLWHDDIVVWKVADRDRDKDRALRVLHWFIDATAQRRYEVIDRQLFDGGLVQQHILHATGHNGGVIAMRVGIIIKLGADGRISRIDEYFDPAEIAPLLEPA
ncbi:nuclear transport factor 2 family protein [Mycolicibacterium novocastrense]|uniref:Ketosteroid isomerase-like protein n=1 Tax=Mycolicibacterium novocastrense TaxID=59813 RepID=A0AAW5SI19_MYCNV|nr:nuclear transport factor 2 family protein [Mycolicibacterium novocastrense]MCV7023708.1 nuclear transport factor 2 family protein [Mycolicibacterium novocastrense]GAT07430.1 ketosteroid isomerase-like protein [Mycolicibacterium novocastrense]